MHGPLHEYESVGRGGKAKSRNGIALVVFLAMIGYGFWSFAPLFYVGTDFGVAKVQEVVETGSVDNGLFVERFQILKVDKLNDPIRYVLSGEGNENQLFEKGSKLIYGFNDPADLSSAFVVDHYRLPYLALVFFVFVFVSMFFSGRAAIYSFLALGFSIFVLIKVVIGMILQGYSPFLVTVLGAFLISVVSVYLGHGFKKQTHIAVAGILLTLSLSTVLAWIFVKLSRLFGMGSEEAFFLQLDVGPQINLQGLFLAGIIIGTLGVLDDITTSQAAVVRELRIANKNLSSAELYKRGLRVGKEHISALINTLVLAYAGASLPLFVLFATEQIQPIWVILNSEFMAEEIMRTIVGSVALVLSVPITTYLAARFK